MTNINTVRKQAQKRREDPDRYSNLLKRRIAPAAQHIRRSPQDVVDHPPSVGGGLAPSRGDAVGGGPASTPAASGGNLASTRGDSGNTAGSSHDNPAPSSTSSADHNTWDQNNNGGGQASMPAPTNTWGDNNNNNNGNHDGQSSANQWSPQPTPSQQQHQDQWQQPSSSSAHNDWNSWDNQDGNNNNGGDTWQNTQQQQNTWQPMSSSSNQWEQSMSASPSATSESATTPASSPGSDSPSSSAILPVTNGIGDTANAVDADGVSSEASTANSKSSKLGAGGTAGIVIAVLVALALLAAVFVYRRRKRNQAAREYDYGTGRGFMTERFSTASSFYGVPNASTTSGGFIMFNDNASTHTAVQNSPSVGSIIHHSPTLTSAPPAGMSSLQPRQEQPDDDDASHYDQETADGHGDLGRPSSAYYGSGEAPFAAVRSQRTPEYNLPTPPIPAFDSEEAILASRSISNNMAYIASGRAAGRQVPDGRRALNRSISSQHSYVDEQLRDLYVGHY